MVIHASGLDESKGGIAKVGKQNLQPGSYRPISLTSFLLKILEKVLDGHIRGRILTSNPLNVRQYAYQQGKSTELSLNNLVGEIKNTFNRKEIAVGIFLDIEGEFNNVTPQSLLGAVKARGVEATITEWIEQMLKNRIATTSLSGESVRFVPGRGCPHKEEFSLLFCGPC
ncbi:uncharacterized protein LOC115884150 [Sitophilus oryzae]|uniref:Uncharacterized protein LOC115884150 n=1 Tax=Sitophilus oryzae TaxID=7048 RepID=A0A6J2Y3X7_SITOR|nr:uncharacterized protein LOC115884150 [Sitophilus oryzae]